jgi:hypothetical protein
MKGRRWENSRSMLGHLKCPIYKRTWLSDGQKN